jgi:uncharacterized membrane protein YuzA (DUF378 family)
MAPKPVGGMNVILLGPFDLSAPIVGIAVLALPALYLAVGLAAVRVIDALVPEHRGAPPVERTPDRDLAAAA